MTDSLQSYRQDLTLRGYSPKTQKTYFACVRKFLTAAGKPPDALARDDVKSHLFRILDSGKCSVSTMNQTYSALKYFFSVTLSKPWELDGIPRVKKQTKLPPILSKEEVLAVIRHAANVKHRALLALVYGSGLRVGEIPKLTTADIMRDKLRLKINQGKGAKDRYAILSSLCLDYLGYYWRCYRPTVALFEGRHTGRPISVRACQHAFAANHRIVKVEDGEVWFSWKDYRDSNKRKLMALPADEFMRRFCRHIVPKRFVRIRYFGLMSHRLKRAALYDCRVFYELPAAVQREEYSWQDVLLRVTGIEASVCPACKQGRMVETFQPMTNSWRAPPATKEAVCVTA